MFSLIGFFCVKYIRPKKLSFMTMKSDAKVEERLTFDWETDMRNMTNFYQSTWKSKKLGLWRVFLFESRKCTSLKFTEKLCLMTIENDAKFEEESTCCFKIDMKDLTNFVPNTWKSQKC